VRIIGTTTTYLGHEIPGYHGQRVRIFAVMRAGEDIDSDETLVTDDDTLGRLGGVTEHDRVDVAHLRSDGTASFVHCDVRAVDLASLVAWLGESACPISVAGRRTGLD
jgi:hypothetical protein